MITLFQTLHTLGYVVVHRVEDRMTALKNEETGASAVEYAILVGILAAALVIAIGTFKDKLVGVFNAIKFTS